MQADGRVVIVFCHGFCKGRVRLSADPDVLKQLTTQGLDARGGSPEEFALFIKNETERWARVIHQMDAAKENKEGTARP